MSDTELLDLIPFFERLSQVDNVYTVLRNSNHAALTNRSDSIVMANQNHNNPTVDLNSVALNVA
jgi:carboxy-terminal domain RNA polymerase II polypeptide A small phosphatase